MKGRKHSKLKRNPIVRFIRGIFRLLRVLFKPKPKNLRAIQDERSEQIRAELARRQIELEQQQIELERRERERERLITVGALFDRVKWQAPELTILQDQSSDRSTIVRPHDVSRN
jgi:hypothetical protein